MGTRCLTIVRDSEGRDVLTLYRQFDGMPDTHGKALATFLAPFKIRDGIGSYEEQNQANGAGCLAAQIVAHFKRRKPKNKHAAAQGPIGNFYIEPSGSKDVGEKYVYIVNVTDKIEIDVLDGRWKSFVKGSPAQIKAWISKKKRAQKAKA